jgi:hypothetical protein
MRGPSSISIQVPDADAETEQDRGLLRSRQQLMKQQNDPLRHTKSLLRRDGLHYKAETQNKTRWTKHHNCWLERTAEGVPAVSVRQETKLSAGGLCLNLLQRYQESVCIYDDNGDW